MPSFTPVSLAPSAAPVPHQTTISNTTDVGADLRPALNANRKRPYGIRLDEETADQKYDTIDTSPEYEHEQQPPPKKVKHEIDDSDAQNTALRAMFPTYGVYVVNFKRPVPAYRELAGYLNLRNVAELGLIRAHVPGDICSDFQEIHKVSPRLHSIQTKI